MTKKQNPTPDDCKSRKRILKPVVEKKRRDRINQSLAELRRLLLDYTADPRLQNPRVEKAEILDLTVEYLQKWSEGRNRRSDSTDDPVKATLLQPETSCPLSIEGAGFQQCVARLNSYMHNMTQPQRTSLIEAIKHHSEAKPGSGQRRSEPDTSDAASLNSSCLSERKEDESPKWLLPSHSPFQPNFCSTPCHDFLSPPPSPWFSPSFSTFAFSPTFPSLSSHFSFPPSVSPPSSNTSFLSFSPTVPYAGPSVFYFPPITTARSPPHLTQRQASPPGSSTMWRPWS